MSLLIYKIENKVNGKVYIGQTRQRLGRRKSEHLYRLNSGKRDHKLYLAMRKHGPENFKFTKYASVLKSEHLDDLEQEIIKDHNSFDRGYNATPGGDGVSDETRRKLSKAFKGRKIPWHHKVVESRRRNGNMPRKGHGGFGKNNKNSATYRVRCPEGKEIKFRGLRQFCRDNGLSHNLLLATLKGTQNHHKGYVLLKKFND